MHGVNKQNGLPREGGNWFVKDAKALPNLLSRKQHEVVADIVTKAGASPKWDMVLEVLELEPVQDDLSSVVESAARPVTARR